MSSLHTNISVAELDVPPVVEGGATPLTEGVGGAYDCRTDKLVAIVDIHIDDRVQTNRRHDSNRSQNYNTRETHYSARVSCQSTRNYFCVFQVNFNVAVGAFVEDVGSLGVRFVVVEVPIFVEFPQ